MSGYNQWEQKTHAKEWLIYPENIGEHLSLDETAYSKGELYTILTNKSAKGKKGSIVAMIEGVKSEKVIEVLKKIPKEKRDLVKEVSLDMAGNMGKIVSKAFPKAMKVIDRFHVQKMASEAVQELRIKHRWDAIDEENLLLEENKGKKNKKRIAEYNNGDSPKQLLARSRYLLFKSESKWTAKQKIRSVILFKQYPDLEKAYLLSQKLSWIYENSTDKITARTRLANWIEQVRQSEFESFNTISNTINSHYPNILNFFENRSTNASAESFNAKIKAFRAQLRGVVDMEFFLFRLQKLYA